MSEHDRNDEAGARWQRREARQRAERRRMTKHGASLRRVYRDAVLRRAATKRRRQV